MKKLLTASAVLLISFISNFETINAQGKSCAPGKSGSVTGTVIDSKTGLPLSFAEVSVYDAYSHQRVKSVEADESGQFLVDGVCIGTYKLKIYSKGSDTYFSLPFMLSEMGKTKDFDTIKVGSTLLQNTASQTISSDR